VKSKRQLFKDLNQIYQTEFFNQGLNVMGISNETYGKDSMIYLNAGHSNFNPPIERRILERELEERGHKIHKKYFPGSQILEVQVTYFRGVHYDE